MPPRRTALITGASSGIGRAFAEEYAAHHNKDLILVARSGAVLEEMATRLRAAHGCRVDVIVADLSTPAGVAQVVEQVRVLGLTVEVLINNAGFGSIGKFTDSDAERVQQQVALNCGAVAALARAFVPGMAERGFGSVVNVASVAAMAPMPYMSLYAATKAFVLSFSEGLREEVRPFGVRVVALCPGPVATGFMTAATGDASGHGLVTGRALTPINQVVHAALQALRRNRGRAVPGWKAPLMAQVLRFTPTRGFAAVARRVLARRAVG